ncbi:hypothetical protein H5410_031893 [Solanum commersonii]|uniref:Uncharacterized protein n=1 Tax=Solanum commersonii TaxID=4109 RepID=A0A9J5YIF3_SOLCO|nr:hypothetical protein H5410_031893 [Solanum commersonii]
MFGMAELQLRIGGRPVIDAEMETMAKCYPVSESIAFLCKTGPAFLEPLDDDEATDDEATDNVVDGETNALMVFNGVSHDSSFLSLMSPIDLPHSTPTKPAGEWENVVDLVNKATTDLDDTSNTLDDVATRVGIIETYDPNDTIDHNNDTTMVEVAEENVIHVPPAPAHACLKRLIRPTK